MLGGTDFGSFNTAGIGDTTVKYTFASAESATEATYKVSTLDFKFTLDGKVLEVNGSSFGELTDK